MDIPTYLKTRKFRPHHMGNYALFGINTFGCSSIINVRDTEREAAGLPQHIWKFHSFPSASDYVATYINEEGSRHTFDFRDSNIYNNTTRLEEYDE
jgi:hypothetical protein